MDHRKYSGRIAYLKDGLGETGRESFSVTVQHDGSRTLRAECEMDNFNLLRDLVLTIDGNWRPIDAYVRETKGGTLSGVAWYSFDGCVATCHGLSGLSGAFQETQTTERPIQSFGSHSLQNDAWLLARVRLCGGDVHSLTESSFTTSMAADGGTGPTLFRVPSISLRIRDFGTEALTVQAGRFEAHHIRVEVTEADSFDIWAAGADCLPVRIRANRLGQTYELVEVQGEVR